VVTKLDSVLAENKALQARVDEMNKCGEKTQQELQTKNTTLSTKVAKLESECKSLEEAIGREKAKAEESVAALKSEISQLNGENSQLKSEASQLRSSQKESVKEIERLKESLSDTETQRSGVNVSIKTFFIRH